MIVTLKRKETEGAAIFGDLYLDGVFQCLTLERQGVEIPPGTYPVALTTSQRARKGELWSPRKDCCLYLIDGVPERSGIRFHAGNTPEQTEGCVLVGTVRLGASIHNSRGALTALMDKLAQARGAVKVTVE